MVTELSAIDRALESIEYAVDTVNDAHQSIMQLPMLRDWHDHHNGPNPVTDAWFEARRAERRLADAQRILLEVRSLYRG